MTTKERLLQEIESAPDFLLTQVLDFFLFLKQRLSQRELIPETAPSVENTTPLFFQAAQEISGELAKDLSDPLPTDFARNLDHYLYGFPKDEP
ncbi:MAG: hypothetical protein AAGA67_06450 [Cyanobacteria bacterium P01_F01_bin.153]